MERHTDHDACHGEFGYTGLEELTAEVTFLDRVGLLKKTVGLIGVGEVGRRNDHVAYVLREEREHYSTRITGSSTGFLLNQTPVDAGHFARHEGLVFVGCERVLLFPLMVSRIFLVRDLTQFDSTVFV